MTDRQWQETFISKIFGKDPAELDIEGAFHLKAKHVPLFLYKYRTCNSYSFENLRDETIWLGEPSAMNDPYDCAHYFDLKKLDYGVSSEEVDSILRDLSEDNRTKLAAAFEEISDQRNAAIIEHFSSHIKQAFKFCSFSERVDSPLMWAHYSDSHRGFCIEYATGRYAPSDYRIRFLYPVQYAESLFDATDCYLAKGETREKNNLRLTLAALYKSMDWAYEREWRLVFAHGVIDSPSAYRMPTPSGVYLGSKISQPDEDIVRSICADKQIPIFKMHHSTTKFEMRAVKLG